MYTEKLFRLGLCLLISLIQLGSTSKAQISIPAQSACAKIGADSVAFMNTYAIYQDSRSSIGKADLDAATFRKAIWQIMDEGPGLRKRVFVDAAKFYRSSLKAVGEEDRGPLVDTLIMIAERRMTCYGEQEKVLSFLLADLARWQPSHSEILPLSTRLFHQMGEGMPSHVADIYFKYSYKNFSDENEQQETFFLVIDELFKLCAKKLSTTSAEEVEQKKWKRINSYVERVAMSESAYWTETRTLRWIETAKGAILADGERLMLAIYRLENFKSDSARVIYNQLRLTCYADTTLSQKRSERLIYEVGRMAKNGVSETATEKLQDEIQFLKNEAAEILDQEIVHALLSQYYYSLAEIKLSVDEHHSALKNAQLAIENSPEWRMAKVLYGDILADKSDCKGNDRLHMHYHLCAALAYYRKAKSDMESRQLAESRIAYFNDYLLGTVDLFNHGISENEVKQLGCWTGISCKVCVKPK